MTERQKFFYKHMREIVCNYPRHRDVIKLAITQSINRYSFTKACENAGLNNLQNYNIVQYNVISSPTVLRRISEDSDVA